MELEQIKRLNREYEDKSAQDVLKWALGSLHPNIALASSFGAEDVVLIDMMAKINPEARVFTLDTGRLNQETYDVMDEIKDKYGIRIEVMFPDRHDVEQMVRAHGMNLFYKSMESRKLCCGVRKVQPLNKILATLGGWITGLRSDQTDNRSGANKVEIDAQHGGMVKVNPIIDWTWERVLDYIKTNNVPYNKLHDNGYPSIGCAPCTRAIKPGEPLRAGRWWWETDPQKECGLHADHGHNPPSKNGAVSARELLK